MPRWLLWLVPALVIATVIGLVAWRSTRAADDDAEAEIAAAPPEDEATPSRAETEEQMRAIGYVQ
jgi:cytochrome c-type biogenesis protein CcmH/NrfF